MPEVAPPISVLMSVYNGERYLAAAMDSILAQTFRDFELIVIDDGSKDSSPAILQKYAKQDSRVKLTLRENKGLTVTLNEAQDFPKEVLSVYQARRDALCDGLDRMGWDMARPKGTMFAWAPIPEPYLEMGSIEFCSMVVKEAQVATSPGVGFGPDGDTFCRFALIENDQRIHQGMRNLKKALTKLG